MSVASNVFCIEFQLDLESLCSSDWAEIHF